MICGMTFFQICSFFLIYSFLGWVIEVIFHAVTLGKGINRGFMNGPVCPVYGFGVITVFAMVNVATPEGKTMGFGLIFLFGVVLATAVELIAGWLLDICFHARWWDYSKKPFNFKGYICLEFSLIWGLAIVLVVKVLQVYLDSHFALKSSTLGWIILAILYVIFFVDFGVTVAVTIGLNKKLTQLDKLRAELRIGSDKLTDTLGTKTIDATARVEGGQVQMSLAKMELRDVAEEKKAQLMKEYEELSNSIIKHTFVGKGRILKAFPTMSHRMYSEILQELKNRLPK